MAFLLLKIQAKMLKNCQNFASFDGIEKKLKIPFDISKYRYMMIR